MTSQSTRKSLIYSTSVRFKRNIFLIFFVVSSLFILAAILFLIEASFPEQSEIDLFFGLKIQKSVTFLLVGIIGAIVATVLGSFFSVLFELPSIFIKFDDIKNAIANREIRNSIQLAQKINEFFVKNLHYTFLSVDYSLVKILKHPIQSSTTQVLNFLDEKDLDAIEKIARESSDVQQYDTFTVNGKKIRSYVVPIYFVNQYLGFWVVLTGSRLLRPFLDFLSDIEDHLIDDQVMHALNSEKMILQRQFYKEFDTFSDKITLQQYTTLSNYLEDIVRLTVETCNVMGGVCITLYNDECTQYFHHAIGESEQAKLVEAAIQQRPSKSKIIKIPEYKEKYIFVLPIMIKELRGFLYLIDDSRSNLEYFSQMLQDIENLKIDNDLEQLSSNLGLSAVRTLA